MTHAVILTPIVSVPTILREYLLVTEVTVHIIIKLRRDIVMF